MKGLIVEDQIHRFRHHDITGVVIRIMEDENLSLNEFLAEDHQLDAGDEYGFAYTCCYLKHRGRHILIDAGFDPDTTPGALESFDVAPEDIDLVLLTHADRDHIAGLMMPDGSFTYPNAGHVISKQLWDNLSNPATLEALGDQRGLFYRRFVKMFDEAMQLCGQEEEIFAGIRFIPCPGHCIGHAAYEFATKGAPLLHSGDSFLHPIFAEHPDWINVIDAIPDQAADSRKLLTARAAESNALILSSHTPFPGIGRLKKIDHLLYQWTQVEIESKGSRQ